MLAVAFLFMHVLMLNTRGLHLYLQIQNGEETIVLCNAVAFRDLSTFFAASWITEVSPQQRYIIFTVAGDRQRTKHNSFESSQHD